MEIFLLALALIAIAFLGLGVNIFFTKKGKFPETEVGQNKHMKELGISCAKCDEMSTWRKARNAKQSFTIPKELDIDLSKF